jgi:hypothetical protein
MRDSGILRSFAVFAPQDDVRTIFSHAVRREAGDAYARDDSKIVTEAPLRCSDQPEVDGPQHGAGAVADAELRKHARDVILHRAVGNLQ